MFTFKWFCGLCIIHINCIWLSWRKLSNVEQWVERYINFVKLHCIKADDMQHALKKSFKHSFLMCCFVANGNVWNARMHAHIHTHAHTWCADYLSLLTIAIFTIAKISNLIMQLTPPLLLTLSIEVMHAHCIHNSCNFSNWETEMQLFFKEWWTRYISGFHYKISTEDLNKYWYCLVLLIIILIFTDILSVLSNADTYQNVNCYYW